MGGKENVTHLVRLRPDDPRPEVLLQQRLGERRRKRDAEHLAGCAEEVRDCDWNGLMYVVSAGRYGVS